VKDTERDHKGTVYAYMIVVLFGPPPFLADSPFWLCSLVVYTSEGQICV
jgi:hypothetical protein